MEVNLIKENKDGSADYSFDLSENEKEMLLKWAIIESLKRVIEEGKKYATSETDLGNSRG